MSGWIKVEKDLRADIRVKRMAAKLIELGSVTQVRYRSTMAVTLVLGGLNQLWMHADTFAREDDSLEITAEEIDELAGIEGFAQILPADWLQILDSERVKLPGFQDHNGAEAKRKALTAKRVSKHRSVNDNAPALQQIETCNAHALPDQTRPDHKEEEAPAAPPPPRKARKSQTTLPASFELDSALREYAESKLPQVDAAALFESFCGKARAKSWVYADWRQAWQEFCRNTAPNSGHWSSGQYPKKANGGRLTQESLQEQSGWR